MINWLRQYIEQSFCQHHFVKYGSYATHRDSKLTIVYKCDKCDYVKHIVLVIDRSP